MLSLLLHTQSIVCPLQFLSIKHLLSLSFNRCQTTISYELLGYYVFLSYVLILIINLINAPSLVVLLDISTLTMSVKCLNLTSNCVYISHHVKFIEHQFPLTSNTSPIDLAHTISTWSSCSLALVTFQPSFFCGSHLS